jgi:hypothetical protein
MLSKLKTVVNLVLVCLAIDRAFMEYKRIRRRARTG